MEPIEKISKTNYKVEDVYDERSGYGLMLSRKDPFCHIGYTSETMKPCRCGAIPVMEQYVDDTFIDAKGEKQRNFPAKDFIAICPVCEIKANGHGTLEECVIRWNAGDFSRDSVLMNTPLTDMDNEGCRQLSNRVVESAVEEALELVKEKNRLLVILRDPQTSDLRRETNYTLLKTVREKMREIEMFLRNSPVMMEYDGDAVLSGIRRTLHPELESDERIEKIPLELFYM